MAAHEAGLAPTHRWYGLDLEVRGVPAGAEYVPVAVEIDLSARAAAAGERGPVDPRALRLWRLEDDGRAAEVPWQFSLRPQARHGERRLRPGTPPTVSWVAEWGAEEAPPVPTAGTLAFCTSGGGSRRYRLAFGVPAGGTAVQVPFPPGNLCCFDAEGRPTALRWFPEMQIRPQWPHDGVVRLERGGAPVATYHLGPERDLGGAPRRPYLHPVIGPDGDGLTDLGKPHDPTGSHAHHYGLWVAHAAVGGVDFWSERGGVIRHEACDLLEDGPLFCRLEQRLRWTAGERSLLAERRTITVHNTPEAFRLIDLDLEFLAAGEAVELGQTSFGFLAARVAQSMTVFDGAGVIENADGARNEQGAHRRRARWIDQSGPVGPGRWAGLALLDHPSNPNHPTHWHCRNDGWAGASLTLDGARRIAAGEPLRLRYRVHLHRGGAAAGQVERRFQEFACRPEVEVGAAQRAGEA